MLFPEGRILVFCKAPVAGRVKTRLARAIGDKAAARCHQALALHCLAKVTQAGLAPVQLWCAPDARHPFFVNCRTRFPCSLHDQCRGDLGERMGNALDSALAGADYALLIGTDCPVMDVDYLHEALTCLQGGTAAVLGPAEDGGYVMLGLPRNEGRLFVDIPWGSNRVLEITRQRLGDDCRELPVLWDVDHAEDLLRLKSVADSLNLSPDFRALLARHISP